MVDWGCYNAVWSEWKRNGKVVTETLPRNAIIYSDIELTKGFRLKQETKITLQTLYTTTELIQISFQTLDSIISLNFQFCNISEHSIETLALLLVVYVFNLDIRDFFQFEQLEQISTIGKTFGCIVEETWVKISLFNMF